MNANERLPADQPARSAIAERLDENLVVEAGAGTGKTRSLVERVTALVTTGAATMDGVAAITFTEAAAAELRERIRQSLEQAASASTTPSAETKRCLQAVEDLDQGAIQTLHGFAASLLRQRPLEAGLPPGFETLDATQSDMAFEDRWSRWLDAALEDPEAQEALRPALVLGLELRHLREIATQFHENYDLLASVSFSAPPIPGPAGARALVDAQGPAGVFVHTGKVAGQPFGACRERHYTGAAHGKCGLGPFGSVPVAGPVAAGRFQERPANQLERRPG